MKEFRTRSWSDEPVSITELNDFYRKVQKLANRTFGVDDEGDSTVEVNLVDRTHGRMPHFRQVPYDNGFEDSSLNLLTAFSDWEIHRRIRQYRKDYDSKAIETTVLRGVAQMWHESGGSESRFMLMLSERIAGLEGKR